MASGDLNLDALLGERYVKHYLRILRSANPLFYVTPIPDEPDGWTTTVTRPPEVTDPLIGKHGLGPVNCSSSTALELYPLHCWDVRGYYARLGVHWKATRRELREAYVSLGGPEDVHLTYAFKQLMNSEIRKAYDQVPLGGDWFDDEAREQVRREAAQEAARRTERSGRAVDYASVLTERGFVFADPEATDRAGRVISEEPGDPEDRSASLGASVSGWEMLWGWYMMDGAVLPTRPGDVLGPWQEMLIEAFHTSDLRIQFAVGFFPGKRYRLWRNSRGLCIVFLANNEPPTPALATEAVKGYLAQEQRR